MGSIFDRMKYAGPLWKEMRDRFNNLITLANTTRAVLIGLNPHLVDDGTNTASAATVASLLNAEAMRDAHQALYVAYEAHRASGTYHAAADATNTLAAEPTPKAVYDLLNNLKTKYNAHRVLTAGTVHGAADSTNVVDAANATTKATAITLANQLKAKFNAHIILTAASVHGHVDAVNTVVYIDAPATATWSHLRNLADQIRDQYEAHRVFTDDSCHGAADNTNSATVELVGDVDTRDIACVNDIKAKFNAHLILASSHKVVEQTFKVLGTDATTSATALTLTREVLANYKNHISRAVYAAASAPAVETI